MNEPETIDISKLSEGDIIKNYKELCRILNIEPKTSNSKKAQLKELERYFKYDKKGHSFIISHIYKVPLPANHNKTKHIATIEKLILDKIVRDNENGLVFISKTQLLKELQMININYTYAKYRQLRLSEHMDITIEEVAEFYMTSDDLLKRNIESALNSLRKQALLHWTYAVTLCFIEARIEKNMNNDIKINKQERVNDYEEKSTLFYSSDPKILRTYRKATKDEISLILQTEEQILKKYNCSSIKEIYKHGLQKTFYKEVKDILFDIANIYFYFNSYEIVANENYIYSKWEELDILAMNEDDKEDAKDSLNNDIIERLLYNAGERHNKAIEKINDVRDETKKNKLRIRLENEYINNNKKLTDTLINKDAAPLSLDPTFYNK